MRYLYFIGCQIPARVNYCDLATRRVAKALGIELVDLQDAGCCGFYIRSVDPKASDLLAARILALTERTGMDLMLLCNSCYAHLKETVALLKESPKMRREINEALADEGLRYTGKARIRSILQVLYHDYTVNEIRTKVKRHLRGLKVAVHYGCHLLRPSRITQFDNPEDPRVLDELVEATGATSIYWPLKLWCCGFPTFSVDQKMGLGLTRNKLRDAKDAGADCIVTTCPSCQISFDMLQRTVSRTYNEKYDLPVLFYPQLLGLALGLPADELGLKFNRVPTEPLLRSIL
jgi:heterodisulfide reductase subunit B